jgi:two-component system sensor histidine kinase KdpD
MMTELRPNPDELLSKIQLEDERQQRGRLKIFFGACAGVGKTYALLNNAQTLRVQGIDVVVGIVETHGRRDTADMLKNLEILPLQTLEYRGKAFKEFDIDAALARKPELILIDELAHTNIKGSRHEKRWQDIEELLSAGIDVHTTVNVQHLESLNDVVTQITGIRVTESFPDHVFDDADEVTLVDLPPEELLQRLKEGKVYVAEQTPHAVQNFFRKGNLIALRELALRRMADRVDVQMREYREDQSIQRVWQTKERLLVCVGPQENSEKIIRAASRLATHLRADWYAVYVETPNLQRLSKVRRDQILKNLKLAEDLGAETATIAGTDRASMLINYAHNYNITKIVVGRSPPPTLFTFWRKSLAEQLSELATDIDIHVVGQENKPERSFSIKPVTTRGLEYEAPKKKSYLGYFLALISCAAITGISFLLNYYFGFDEPDIVMLYLLSITFTAIYFGLGPSILASVVSVAAFDFFFISPKWSFSVEHPQALLTFAIMFLVGIIISNLTSNLRYQVRVATYREQRTNAVYALSKELSAALSIPQIIEIASRHLSTIFQIRVMVLLPDMHDSVHPKLAYVDPAISIMAPDLAIAQWVYDNEKSAGWSTQTLPASPVLFLPLRAPTNVRGVLAIEPLDPLRIFLPEQQRLLETFAAQIALALERVHYAEAAKNALLSMEAERLRNILLSVISRDLRSPLNDILNLSNALFSEPPAHIDKTLQELAKTLPEKTQLVNSLINNLLDMARLQVDGVPLNKRLDNFCKLVRAVLQAHAYLLQNHQIQTHLPKDLPAFYFDATLMERVLSNLLENAGKYTPSGSEIIITLEHRDGQVWLTVEDNGPGFPPEMEEEIFGKFTRGEHHGAIPGAGLGLAVCRAIIEAHEGRIHAENRPQGGAKFIFWIPFEISATAANVV